MRAPTLYPPAAAVTADDDQDDIDYAAVFRVASTFDPDWFEEMAALSDAKQAQQEHRDDYREEMDRAVR